MAKQEPKENDKPILIYAMGIGWIAVRSEEEYYRYVQIWKEREIENKRLQAEYLRKR